MDVSSVHWPAWRSKGPPPTISVNASKVSRCRNSTVVPTASPAARPTRQPRNLSSGSIRSILNGIEGRSIPLPKPCGSSPRHRSPVHAPFPLLRKVLNVRLVQQPQEFSEVVRKRLLCHRQPVGRSERREVAREAYACARIPDRTNREDSRSTIGCGPPS